MHRSSYLRMEWFKNKYLLESIEKELKILDIGAMDIGGCYKPIFREDKWDYYGMDMEYGENIDICVDNPYDWKEIEDEPFDVIISGQAFEHMEFFWLVMEEISRALKPNGLCCIIAPSQGYEHRYPVDCYRYYSDGMYALAKYVDFDVLHVSTGKYHDLIEEDIFQDNYHVWKDSMLVARKKNDKNEAKHISVKKLHEIIKTQKSIISEQKDIINNYKNSKSWKITEPLRKVKKILTHFPH